MTHTPLWPTFTKSPCLKSRPLHIFMGLAHEGDDDSDITDGDPAPSGTCSTWTNHGLRFHEPESRTPLILQTATATTIQERLGVLKVLVTGDGGTGNLTRFNGLAIKRGDDANHAPDSTRCNGATGQGVMPWA